jgi:hypothetical protein
MDYLNRAQAILGEARRIAEQVHGKNNLSPPPTWSMLASGQLGPMAALFLIPRWTAGASFEMSGVFRLISGGPEIFRARAATPGNHTAETRLPGWGERTRTQKWEFEQSLSYVFEISW